MSGEFDLGSYSRTVTTDVPEAQVWFDRGLNWTFGFNHEEAIACYEQALAADPDCAMAHWGIAYAIGPNYNKPWILFDPADLKQSVARAFDESRAALALVDRVTPAERALIHAIQTHYPQREPIKDCRPWDHAFAAAMRDVHTEFSSDLDISTFFVEAIMNLKPWKLWNLQTGEPTEGAGTEEARDVLETAFRNLDALGANSHPGLLHLYVHLMEMSPFPEKALVASDRLRTLVPDAGHLIHMATHIDVQCGYYRDVVEDNHKAIVADRKYLAANGAMNFYTAYRIHNYHFKVYGAMFLGQFSPAIEAAEELIATMPDELLRLESPPMADWLEGYVSMKQHVLVRFGKWAEILAQPLPDDPDVYCNTTAMIHYAKAVAAAASGDVTTAEKHRTEFLAARLRVPDTRYVHNNTCVDILGIAEAMLEGELEYRRGNFTAAFTHLREAVRRDDALPYDEPWGWMQPPRHALGALLLEQGQVAEAEAVYRADLGLDGQLSRASQHPDNVWSLHGLHECLNRRNAGAEEKMIKQRLDLAAARADVPITASCYCRLQHAAA